MFASTHNCHPRSPVPGRARRLASHKQRFTEGKLKDQCVNEYTALHATADKARRQITDGTWCDTTMLDTTSIAARAHACLCTT